MSVIEYRRARPSDYPQILKLQAENFIANLSPEASELDYDPGNRFSVPYAWGTTGLCYSQERVGRELTSWGDLLDPSPDLQGKVTMLGTDRWLLLPALKQLGFSANTVDEGELAQAQQILVDQNNDVDAVFAAISRRRIM